MHDYDDTSLDILAADIKKIYLERKNSLMNGRFKLSGEYASHSHWLKAAAVCKELGASPEGFIKAAFSYCNLKTGPYPNGFTGTCARNWYRQYASARQEHIVEEDPTLLTREFAEEQEDESVTDLRLDIDYVKRSLMRLTGRSTVDAVTLPYLASMSNSYMPYVRALLGHGDPNIKRYFGAAALTHFHKYPGVVRAAEKLGYPIANIISWLSATKN